MSAHDSNTVDLLERRLATGMRAFVDTPPTRIPAMPTPTPHNGRRRAAIAAAAAIAAGAVAVHANTETGVTTHMADSEPRDAIRFDDLAVSELMGYTYTITTITRAETGATTSAETTTWIAGTIVPQSTCTDPCPVTDLLSTSEAAELLAGHYQLTRDHDTVTLTRIDAGAGDYVAQAVFRQQMAVRFLELELTSLAGTSWHGDDNGWVITVGADKIDWDTPCGHAESGVGDQHGAVTGECAEQIAEMINPKNTYMRLDAENLEINGVSFTRIS